MVIFNSYVKLPEGNHFNPPKQRTSKKPQQPSSPRCHKETKAWAVTPLPHSFRLSNEKLSRSERPSKEWETHCANFEEHKQLIQSNQYLIHNDHNVLIRLGWPFRACGILQMLNLRTPRMAFSPGLPLGGLELGSGAEASGSNGCEASESKTRYFGRGRPPEITLSAILGSAKLWLEPARGRWLQRTRVGQCAVAAEVAWGGNAGSARESKWVKALPETIRNNHQPHQNGNLTHSFLSRLTKSAWCLQILQLRSFLNILDTACQFWLQGSPTQLLFAGMRSPRLQPSHEDDAADLTNASSWSRPLAASIAAWALQKLFAQNLHRTIHLKTSEFQWYLQYFKKVATYHSSEAEDNLNKPQAEDHRGGWRSFAFTRVPGRKHPATLSDLRANWLISLPCHTEELMNEKPNEVPKLIGH